MPAPRARNQARRYGYAAADPGEADDPRDAGFEPRCGWDGDGRWECWLVEK